MTDDKTNNDDQLERADEEAARAAAAAEEAVEAAGEESPAAAEAVEAAETAEAAAEAVEEKPARKPRAKKAAPKAEAEAAAEAPAEEAKPTQTTSSSGTGKRTRAKKAEETETAEQAEPAKRTRTAPARRRDQRREAPVGVEVRAQAKYVRTSARKARLVCDHIRGKDVAQARAILAFTPRAAAKDWAKLLESAVANAEHNHELVGEELKIAAVYADEGPTLKRFRPRAMGRATRIRKRTSHLSITLTPKES